jgi:hypothetical protein
MIMPYLIINTYVILMYVLVNYTGPGEIFLELITNLNVILYFSTCHTVHIIVLTLFMIMPYLIINTYVILMYELK